MTRKAPILPPLSERVPEPSGPVPIESIERMGREIRDLRKARRLTLARLSTATGLSVGHLSEIERGLASPSIKALRDIAVTLGVTIGWFFHGAVAEDEAESDFVVRGGRRRSLGFASGIAEDLLSPNLHGDIELLLSRLPPGASSGEEPYGHRGEEAGVVIEGTLDLWIGERRFRLEAGDSFGFPSHLPHRCANPGTTETRVVWVITPPSY